MSEVTICLKQYINKEDYKKIDELKNISLQKEDISLKVELDYKLSIMDMNRERPFEDVNEFFYYSDDKLVGYLGILCMDGITGELTGLVHPDYRRKGIFTRLYNLAKEECIRRNFEEILLVCDNKALSGIEFIKSLGAEYNFSEYEMKMDSNYTAEASPNISLRKASNSDAKELARQDSIYFGVEVKTIPVPEEEEKRGRVTYMVELESKVIGKIRITTEDGEGFIAGFGILPEYRGKGFGREALKAALYMLSQNNIHRAGLEVAAHNKNALNLYKSCGFVEQSVMDYYLAKK